jgi:putative transposase
VATTSDIKVLRTPYRTPSANAVCERFLGSVRRACLDHFLIFQEKQLYRLLKAYIVYFNQARTHQGLGQRIPDPPVPAPLPLNQVIATPVLGGLHHDDRKTAERLESVHLKSKENRAAKLHRYVKLKARRLGCSEHSF